MSRKPLPVKLIFNPVAGNQDESPRQLIQTLTEMDKQSIIPEIHMPTTRRAIKAVVRRAQQDGTQLIVAAGGDGTIDPVAAALVGTDLKLGIIPAGTRNNLALNLGIPGEIPQAVEFLRTGKAIKIDLGEVNSVEPQHFLEFLSLGLISDLYFVTDDIQYGRFIRSG